MSARKATRRPKARKTAIEALLKDGQLGAVRKGFFCESSRNIPIAGTPRPKPCPFCGKDDDISVVIQELKDYKDQPYTRVHIDCGVCGAESPGASSDVSEGTDSYGLVLTAVGYWQRRGGVE